MPHRIFAKYRGASRAANDKSAMVTLRSNQLNGTDRIWLLFMNVVRKSIPKVIARTFKIINGQNVAGRSRTSSRASLDIFALLALTGTNCVSEELPGMSDTDLSYTGLVDGRSCRSLRPI